MPNQVLPEPVNQEFAPILDRALYRVRQLLPPEFGLLHSVTQEVLRVRGDAALLETMLVSSCLMVWQSMLSVKKATDIVVNTGDVVMDEIVLNEEAETLQGGLPPRHFVQIQVGSNLRIPEGPLHVRMPVGGNRPVSAQRMKLLQIRQVVLDHKGTFSVFADPERGSEFDIYLPAASPLDRSAMSETGTTLRHVLYVDDYREMREVVAAVLPDAGFRVTCMNSARSALELFRTAPYEFDALVSDYKLPDYSGIELLKLVHEVRPDLPAVLISGYVDEALRSRAYAEGAAAVISKSEDIDELSRMLRELLETNPNPAPGSFTDWASL